MKALKTLPSLAVVLVGLVSGSAIVRGDVPPVVSVVPVSPVDSVAVVEVVVDDNEENRPSEVQ